MGDFAVLGLQLTANLLKKPEYQSEVVIELVCAPVPANQHAHQLLARRQDPGDSVMPWNLYAQQH